MVVDVVELTVTLGWPGAGSEKIVTFTNTLLTPCMQYDANTFTHYFTCSSSSASDRVTDCTPSSIACCHSDHVISFWLQSCYGVAGRVISDGGTASDALSLPSHFIALHH